MLDCKSMLKNISKGQSSIPLKYLIAGLEYDFQSLRTVLKEIRDLVQKPECDLHRQFIKQTSFLIDCTAFFRIYQPLILRVYLLYL